MFTPTQLYHVAFAPGMSRTELCPALEHVPFVYQHQPVDEKGKPILPHTWDKPDGSVGVQVGTKWTDAAADAPAKLAAYIARTVLLGPSKMLCLNVERVGLDGADAASFWARAFAAIRSAMPGVKLGFYGPAALGHLVDWVGVSLYPNKRIGKAGELSANYNEYWYSPLAYRDQQKFNAAAYVELAREHFRPLVAFGTFRLDGDNGDAPGFMLPNEVDCQLALAAELGCSRVIWWNSATDAKIARRVGNMLREQSQYVDVPRAFDGASYFMRSGA